MPSEKTIISVVGATATGKTALSLALAKHFDTCIISFDSRQCYKELSIGTAKPPLVERANIPHYFIDTHSIDQQLSVKDFVDYAQGSLEEIFQTHSIAILVGGTGFFWTALCYGLDEIPPVPSSLRDTIKREYETKGFEWLSDALHKEDAIYAQQGEMLNPQRMMRALEVVRHTGHSIKTFQSGRNEIILPYRHLSVGLRFVDSDERRVIITQRVHQMLAMGLKDEVLPHVHQLSSLNALQTVGYKEWAGYASGQYSEAETIEAIIRHTIDYAKRQMTWFKRYEDIVWFDRGTTAEKIIDYIQKTM